METLPQVGAGRRATLFPLVVLLICFAFSGRATATVLPPGTSAIPDIFAPVGATLLASVSTPFVSSTGVLSGTVVAAVYSDPTNTFGAGDLDFVYQVSTSAVSTDAISRVTAIDFTGFLTDVGYTATGSALSGGIFVDGTVAPQLVDRQLLGDTVGFTFNAPLLEKVLPGETSTALIIETNATNFGPGFTNVIDGGVTTVPSFQPVPEPSIFALLTLGLVGLAAGGRRALKS